jgi:hypothetical protein
MTLTASTATAPTDAKRDRVVDAAIMWIYDQTCASALAALEEAVEDYVGQPVTAESKS